MRCADRLCAHLLRGRAQGPAKVIQSRRGQRFRRDCFSPWWGSSPAGAFCRPPALFACRLCGGSVLHFLFPGVNSPGFIFLSPCGFPAALCAVSVSLAWAYGVSRGPLRAVPVAVGLAYPAANAPACGLRGPPWAGPGPGVAGGVPGVFGVGRPIFCGGLPDRSARASGGASACAKVAGGKIKTPPTVFTVSGAEL